MNFLSPIFTEKRECQDCYKCLRNCPVKAIKVQAGYASVVAEQCISCGHCVEVCPSGAKKVRDDLPRARRLIAVKSRVIVSLAPSYISEFPGVRAGQIVQALRKLGFWAVSETALGAQEVSAAVAALLAEGKGGIYVSSACPSVVAWFQKHHPELSGHVTGLLSPLLTHCRMLRARYGADTGIVFVGPCVAKKTEADDRPELLDVALTFEDLHRWLRQEQIDPAALVETEEDQLAPQAADEGAWYPIDGGMIAGIKQRCAVNDCSYMSFSGLPAIQKAMQGLEDLDASGGVFMELLACEGGCVNGPKAGRKAATAAKRQQILRRGHYPADAVPRRPTVQIAASFAVQQTYEPQLSETQIREALRTVGKLSAEDELDCGGCGYDSCRQFARALVSQKAERSMCVTYMRKLAHKKANALIQKMPSAVVIVNETLQVLECNAAFAQLFAPDAAPDEQTPGVFEGRALASVLPFHNLFAGVLKTGEDIVDRDLRFRDTILHLSIFTVEKHCVVGGIIQDVTRPAVQKEQVIRKAQEVIQRNLSTVQKIAYLLGENAAESEIALSSIIDSFSPPRPDETGVDNELRKLYRR